MKLLQQLSAVVLMLLVTNVACAQHKIEFLTKADSFEVMQRVSELAKPQSTVALDAHQFRLPKDVAQFSWRQVSGVAVDVYRSYTDLAYFVAPKVVLGEQATLRAPIESHVVDGSAAGQYSNAARGKNANISDSA